MEYLKEMPLEIELKEIKEIIPVYKLQAPSHLKVTSKITRGNVKDVISQIWEWYETDGLNEYFEGEGYRLVKIDESETTSRPRMENRQTNA